jgi:PAS domain S-box-containing protein
MDRPRLFQEMVESVGVGVGIYGADGCYLYVNDAYAEMLGTDRETLVGTHLWDVVRSFEGERFERYWASFADGETRTAEAVHEFGGRSVPVATVTTRRRIDGVPYHFGTIRDITDQRERERELRKQNERLEAFTGVVSHDLRNPLNVAQGYLDILQEDIDRDELALVESSLDRMSILIEDLLRLAREGHAVDDPAPVSLATVAAAARDTVATDGATVETTGDLRFLADESRLQQLLENLFRNSVEHGSTSPDSPARQDSVEHADADEGLTVTVGPLDDAAGFYVEDTGPGIPMAEREAIFSPGRSENGGLGLGLAIVHEIAEAHGWEITITERDGGGARFEISGVEPA